MYRGSLVAEVTGCGETKQAEEGGAWQKRERVLL
jgi:hypothetical protein